MISLIYFEVRFTSSSNESICYHVLSHIIFRISVQREESTKQLAALLSSPTQHLLQKANAVRQTHFYVIFQLFIQLTLIKDVFLLFFCKI